MGSLKIPMTLPCSTVHLAFPRAGCPPQALGPERICAGCAVSRRHCAVIRGAHGGAVPLSRAWAAANGFGAWLFPCPGCQPGAHPPRSPERILLPTGTGTGLLHPAHSEATGAANRSFSPLLRDLCSACLCVERMTAQPEKSPFLWEPRTYL